MSNAWNSVSSNLTRHIFRGHCLWEFPGDRTVTPPILGAVKPAFEDVSVGIFWLSPLPSRNQIEAPTQLGNCNE
jgi:hypothetical protein